MTAGAHAHAGRMPAWDGNATTVTASTARAADAAIVPVLVWFGAATGHWWALVGDRLIEALTHQELDNKITEIRRASQRAARRPFVRPAKPAAGHPAAQVIPRPVPPAGPDAGRTVARHARRRGGRRGRLLARLTSRT